MIKSPLKFLASIKLAVVIILSLAVLIATGTFVEARYDADIAGKLVYKTPWMFAIMGLLATSLIAVMIDRWPWRKKHTPFLMAHVGIICLILGSAITMLYGVDGSMYFPIGAKNRFVQTPGQEIAVWSTFDGSHFEPMLKRDVDYFLHPPKPGTPEAQIAMGRDKIDIVEYWPFALASSKVTETSDTHLGSAIRFQLENGRANINDWLVQKRPDEIVTKQFGPAELHLGPPPSDLVKARGKNEIFIYPKMNKGIWSKTLEYKIFSRDEKRAVMTGETTESGTVATGWMGLEMKVLRFYPHAEENWKVEKSERPTPLTTSAIRLRYKDKEYWLQLDDSLRFFGEDGAYVVTYGHRRLDLGFELALKDFQMGMYPGTNRASSYQSQVVTPDGGPNSEVLISMNEPLHYRGYTFYQASFQSGPDGKPNASILSVNKDPGRVLKYLGALIITLGIVYLFYDRRKSASAAAMRAQGGSHVS